MKFISKSEAKIFKNSEVCTAIEYPLEDKDIDGAVIELKGRYPARGRAVNLECKEMAYIIEGSGKLVVEEKEIKLNKEDLVLIEAGEKFFWDGNMKIFMPCAPAWFPEQHKEVE